MVVKEVVAAAAAAVVVMSSSSPLKALPYLLHFPAIYFSFV